MHEISSFKIFQTAKVIAVLYAISFALIAALQLIAFASLGGRRPPILLIVILPVVGINLQLHRRCVYLLALQFDRAQHWRHSI
jgi:hypothetical protein